MEGLALASFEILVADRVAVAHTGDDTLAFNSEPHQVVGVGADAAFLVHNLDSDVRKVLTVCTDLVPIGPEHYSSWSTRGLDLVHGHYLAIVLGNGSQRPWRVRNLPRQMQVLCVAESFLT